ncbi:MAG TPA: RidA family protein [Clostridiaceae bacterium]|nr:RidA family protein [Clostridiaceae bacterium]
MMKKIISTDKAPGAIGPYSQATQMGNFIFTSGQLPIDVATGNLVEADITAQATKCLENLKALLEAAGSGMDKVLKTTVFLKDMNDFVAMNDVYKTFFTENHPSRSAVQVARLPKDAMIEIEAIASV